MPSFDMDHALPRTISSPLPQRLNAIVVESGPLNSGASGLDMLFDDPPGTVGHDPPLHPFPEPKTLSLPKLQCVPATRAPFSVQ